MKYNINKYTKQILNLGLWLMALPLFLFSCINETLMPEPEDTESELNDEKITFSFQLSLTGNATRSGTDTDGSSDEDKKNDKDKPDLDYKDTYPAVENENIINGFRLYFVSGQSNFYLPSGQTLDFNEDADNEYTKTVTISVKSDELKGFAGQEFDVYFVGNINSTVESALTNFDPMTAKIENIPADEKSWLGVFEKGGFSMPIVSRDEYKVNLTDLDEEDINAFEKGMGNGNDSYKDIADRLRNVLSNAFTGVMTLERINARIDIADGSPDPLNNPNMYPFFYSKTGHEEFFKEDGTCLLNLKLTRIDPITVHKQSYLFRHTAKGDSYGAYYNEASSENPGYESSLFGNENGGVTGQYNWIIDCDAEYKREYKDIWTDSSEANTPLSLHFYDTPLRRDNHSLAWFNGNLKPYTGTEYSYVNSKITFTTHPNDESTHHNHLYEGYSYDSGKEYGNKIYYPWRYMPENTLPSEREMIRGFSTGIRYELILCDENGEPYNWERVDELVDKQEKGEISLPFTFEKYDVSTSTSASQDPTSGYRLRITIGDEMVDEIYQVNGKIRLYYFYFFRHNFDSQNPTDPKPMKYGIVRNNIYRLCLTGFNGLPRPYNFEDPDDPYDLFVDLKVLDWTKRKTAITFK